MKSVGTILLLLLAAFATPAFAQSGAPDFRGLDADNDGRVSLDEAQADARVAEQFRMADTDRDGYLSAEEFSAVWG